MNCLCCDSLRYLVATLGSRVKPGTLCVDRPPHKRLAESTTAFSSLHLVCTNTSRRRLQLHKT